MTATKDNAYQNITFTSIVDEKRNRWLINIQLTNPGKYYVNSPKILGYKNRFYFEIISGPPSVADSFCLPLTYSLTPTLNPGEKVRIQCSIFDSDKNPVPVKKIRDSWQVSFSCEVNKTSPTTETTPITNVVLNDDETFTCEYTTISSGSFNINGKLKMSTKSTTIATQTNIFNVFAAPTSVAKGLVYDWSIYEFVPFPSNEGNASITVCYINIGNSW